MGYLGWIGSGELFRMGLGVCGFVGIVGLCQCRIGYSRGEGGVVVGCIGVVGEFGVGSRCLGGRCGGKGVGIGSLRGDIGG